MFYEGLYNNLNLNIGLLLDQNSYVQTVETDVSEGIDKIWLGAVTQNCTDGCLIM